jgi:hypothetical protein
MPIPELMAAVRLVGHGGFDKLVYSETVAVPAVRPGEVLIKVLAASINNTDINTRIGWYSSAALGGGGMDVVIDVVGARSGRNCWTSSGRAAAMRSLAPLPVRLWKWICASSISRT